MSRDTRPAWIPTDAAVAGAAAAAAGTGVLVAVLGAQARQLPLVLVGGGAVLCALLVILTARWLDGLSLLVLTLPLPALASGQSARLPPVAIITALVVAAWLVRALPERRSIVHGGLPRVPIVIFMGAVVLSSAFAIDRIAAIRELVNLGAMVALLVVVTDELSRRPTARRPLARLVAAVVGVAGGAALLEAVGLLPGEIFVMAGTPFNRATIGFGWPNEAGMFFAVGLPICVYAHQSAVDRNERLAGRLAVAGCLVGLLFTFSRASWLAALLAPAALAFVGQARAAIRAWVIGALGIALIDLASGGALSGRAISLVGDYVVEQRAALMFAGLLMFLDHPWVGIGPGGFVTALQDYGPRIAGLWDYVGSAHNGYVEVAAEMGLVGIFGFVFLMAGTLLKILARARGRGPQDEARATDDALLDRALLWSFATACLVTFTIWPFAHGMGQLLVLVAAMGLAGRDAGRTAAAASS